MSRRFRSFQIIVPKEVCRVAASRRTCLISQSRTIRFPRERFCFCFYRFQRKPQAGAEDGFTRGATMSDSVPVEWDLPKDILIDILGRIPALSLARCSCVAASWREVTKQESSLKRKIGLERAWLHEPINPIIHKGRNHFATLCCAKMKNFIALGGYDGFKVFDFDCKEFIFECEETGIVLSLSFMDGMLVTGGRNRDLCGWDISSRKKLFCVSLFDSRILSIADVGDKVVVGGGNGNLQIWEKGVWEWHSSLEGHSEDVFCLFHQSGNLLISGSRDETIRIWNLVDNACLRVIGGQVGGASSIDVSDGLIFCGAFDGNIRSWEFESGELVQTFQGHKRSMTSVVLQEGRMFTGSFDQTIKMWDTTNCECVRSFDCSHYRSPNTSQKTDLLWVDDETLMAVGGGGKILEWDFSKGL
ncbi:hypothetical protein BSKO_02862 [Bryopsis sp. KO-2023]|nr:hypothetical protein BSKO_02862 [Bryopsis sp. KO-2023]